MLCLQFLLLFSLGFAIHCHPELEDQNKGVETKEANVSLGALQTVVQQQATTIGRLQAELTASKNQVDSCENKMDSYKNRFDSYENRLDSYANRLDSFKNQLDSSNNHADSCENEMDSYKKQVETMSIQLQALQRKADAASKSVAFTARISNNRDASGDYGLALGHEQTVVFDDVVTNIGNAYDKNTGIFTAPINGTYVFFLHQMNPNKRSDLYLAIVKNGVILDMVHSQGKGNDVNDQGSSQVSMHLAAGDNVWVRQYSGDGVRGSWWTVFTGFLLCAK